MLAGIVVTFAINAVKTIPVDPWLILPLIAAFFLIRLFNPALSVLAVLIGGGVAAFLLGRVGGLPTPELSTLVLVTPALLVVGRSSAWRCRSTSSPWRRRTCPASPC